MGKFRKRIVVIGCFILIGFIFYKVSRQSDNNIMFNKKDLIAVYVQNEDNEYKLSNSKKFPTEGYELNLEKSKCQNGNKLSQDAKTKKISLQLSNSDICTLYFDKETIKINVGDSVLKVKDSTPNFAEPANTDETADGLYSMIDDSGKQSYYYRGAVENNYVKFGIDKDGNDMYWRIIRFNGDGSMRMQYEGKSEGSNDTSFIYARSAALAEQVWNTEYYDAKYVGWMFGGAQGEESTSAEMAQTNETDSEIKTAVDTWYKENILETGFHSYVADEIFCNDRSTPGSEVTGWTLDTGAGYNINNVAFGVTGRFMLAADRANEHPQPIFTCPQNNDRFTVSKDAGNGALTYPVGLITGDEVLAAGSGKYGSGSQFYLKNGYAYWLFSPYRFYSISGIFITEAGLTYAYVMDAYSVFPVINIKSEYVSQLIGDGSNQNPFRLSSE